MLNKKKLYRLSGFPWCMRACMPSEDLFQSENGLVGWLVCLFSIAQLGSNYKVLCIPNSLFAHEALC